MEVNKEDLQLAHDLSMRNRADVEASDLCGCYYCLHIFPPSDIGEWVDYDTTPLCPECGIDSVLAEKTGYPITKEFLQVMNRRWF